MRVVLWVTNDGINKTLGRKSRRNGIKIKIQRISIGSKHPSQKMLKMGKSGKIILNFRDNGRSILKGMILYQYSENQLPTYEL